MGKQEKILPEIELLYRVHGPFDLVEKEEKIYWPAPGLVPDAELVIIGSAGRSAVGRTTAQDVIIAAAAGAEIVGGGITG